MLGGYARVNEALELFIAMQKGGVAPDVYISPVSGAQDLPRTKLSDYIEKRLLGSLQRERKQRAEFLGKNLEEVFALAIVSVGVAVAVATVIDLQFHFFGACIGVAWILPSAVNKIMWSNLQQQDNWSALALKVLKV